MIKNLPYVKKYVARMQVKHLLNVNSLDIIWCSFLSLTLNKLLRKPAVATKSLSQLFLHWFTTLSNKLQQITL